MPNTTWKAERATFDVVVAVETGQTRIWVRHPGFDCRCKAEAFVRRNEPHLNAGNYGLEWRIESSLDG